MLEIGLLNQDVLRVKDVPEEKLIDALKSGAKFLQLSETTFVRANDIMWFRETSDSPSSEWHDVEVNE